MTARPLVAGASAVALACAIAACGDLYADPLTEEPVSTPPFDAASLDPRTIDRPCPVARPQENSSCLTVGMTCEYGWSPDMRCNTTLACTSFAGAAAWDPRPSVPCSVLTCPAGTLTELDGTPCSLPEDPDAGPPSDADELVCSVEGGTCACSTGAGGASTHERRWVCVKPSRDCPEHRPRAGQACGAPRWCDYGSCAFKRGLRMECTNGVWLTGGASCS